jgi:hypothetical protein
MYAREGSFASNHVVNIVDIKRCNDATAGYRLLRDLYASIHPLNVNSALTRRLTGEFANTRPCEVAHLISGGGYFCEPPIISA